MEEQLEQSLNYELDGLIVYIDQGAGYPTESYAAGWHNRDQKIPAHKDALFKIASIGKLYDAAAITRLVSAGRLDLDQSLAHYFPEIADRVEFSDKISLRLMLQHRSGIPNFTDSPNFWNIEHGFDEYMGDFRGPDDPSRSGKAPIPIPGKLRLAIEVLEFTLGIWALYALLPSIYGHLSLVVLVVHHLSYTDRLKWIWQQ